MSLLIWLPLQGDFTNNGLINSLYRSTPVSGNSWSDDSKIGGQTLKLTKLQQLLPTSSPLSGAKQLSVCYWVKVNTTWTKDWLDGFRWISTNGSSTATGRQEFYTNCTKVGIWYGGGNNSNKNFTPGVWTHIAFTIDYDAGQSKFYRNGTLIATKNDVTTTHYCQGDCYIGDNGVDINQQDVRVYNHILTAVEIKTIAQGLAIHYKLDQGGINWNLLVDTNAPSLEKVKGGGNRYIENQNHTDYTSTIVEIDDPPVPGIRYGQQLSHTGSNGFHSVVWYSGATVSAINGMTHTMSCYAKRLSGTNLKIVFEYGDGQYTNVERPMIEDNEWHQYSWTFVPNSTYATSNVTRIYPGGLHGNGEVLICGWKFERSDYATPWAPSHSELKDMLVNFDVSRVVDNSGYGNHGIQNGGAQQGGTSPRNNHAYTINNSKTSYIEKTGLNIAHFPLTASIWFKSTNTSPQGSYHQPFMLATDDGKSIGIYVHNNKQFRAGVTANGSSHWGDVTNTNALDGKWHFCTVTYDGTTLKKYFDGELKESIAVENTGEASRLTKLYIGSTPSNQYGCTQAQLSDFRLYSTVLLDNEIKMLYNVSASIRKDDSILTNEFSENGKNLMIAAEFARAAGNGFKSSVGLTAYTQTNCQVTCNSNGYRIYRTPNTAAGSANKTFGGLVLRNSSTSSIHVYNPAVDNIFGLINGHTYVWCLTVEGHAATAPAFYITNNTGYASNAARGLNTTPSNTKTVNIPANFNGKKEIFYRFTISDTIVKTCLQSYSDYTAGNDYLAYRDFVWCWDYVATGENGTDIYVSNIRLYDITNKEPIHITKNAMIKGCALIEENYPTKFSFDSEIFSSQYIER